MSEPHDSLAAFISDLHEQCDLFGRGSPSQFVKDVTGKLKQCLVAAGVVVAAEAKLCDKPKRMGK